MLPARAAYSHSLSLGSRYPFLELFLFNQSMYRWASTQLTHTTGFFADCGNPGDFNLGFCPLPNAPSKPSKGAPRLALRRAHRECSSGDVDHFRLYHRGWRDSRHRRSWWGGYGLWCNLDARFVPYCLLTVNCADSCDQNNTADGRHSYPPGSTPPEFRYRRCWRMANYHGLRAHSCVRHYGLAAHVVAAQRHSKL